jgi:hypothetical protein
MNCEFSNASWHLALHVERLMLDPAKDEKLDELARLLQNAEFLSGLRAGRGITAS